MEITDAMRRAVYAADCTFHGHQFDFQSVVGPTERPNPNDPVGFPMTVLRSSVAGRLPHVTCTRCGAVWLVVDEAGIDYDDAVAKVARRCALLEPGDTAALDPHPVVGTPETPIPLSVDWDALPEDHPAKRNQRQEDAHIAAHADDPVAVALPDPDAPQPEPGSVQVITTEPEAS